MNYTVVEQKYRGENARGHATGYRLRQLILRWNAVPLAASDELRYAALTNNTPGTWTTVPAAPVRTPITLSGLTPGPDYAFEIRTLSTSGYSDWSDSVTCMCK